METIQVGFSYGLLAPSLEEQAQKQGFSLGDKAKSFDEYLDCLNRLYFGDLLSDGELKKLLSKLNKKVVKNLKPIK